MMKKRVISIALAVCTVFMSAIYLRARTYDAVPYPMSYRSWTRVASAIIGPKSPQFAKHGGIHHIYANEKAMEGYRNGQFPDGSVIVADFLETYEVASRPGVSSEGPRRRIDVMVKESKRYAETGGWGFESFRGDSQTDRMVAGEAATKCFACHSSQRVRDCVFSRYRQ